MERYFVGVRVVGRPEAIVNALIRVIRKLAMGRVIPAIKCEKKPGREFYVFLAVNGADPNSGTESVKRVLKYAGMRTNNLHVLSLRDVNSMVGKAEIETFGILKLVYNPIWSNNPGNPFDWSELPNTWDNDEIDLSERYDQLLYWLSSVAEGSWECFARTCTVLGIVKDIRHARYVLQRMILLGHVECKEDGSRWSVCPPTIVNGSSHSFICGQRCPVTVQRLVRDTDVEIVDQPSGLGPRNVRLRNDKAVIKVAETLGMQLVGRVSYQLAGMLPEIGDWKNSLVTVSGINTAKYNITVWDGRGFVPSSLYEYKGRYMGDSGLYRLTQAMSSQPYSLVLYFDYEQQKWFRGDWSGLKFLANYSADSDLEAVFSSGSSQLIVPRAERWPLLYERALVLQTGLLPGRADNPQWLSYSGDRTLFFALGSKLSVDIREVA